MNRYTGRTAALEILMIVIAIIFMVPIYVMVNIALRGTGDASPAIAPTRHPTFSNFVQAWKSSGLGAALITSATITTISVVLIVAFGALAAYGIVRSTTRWSSGAFYLFMLGLLVPFQLTMIPMYQNFARIHEVGTPVTLVIIYVGERIPFTIFLYSAFLRHLPLDYEEAASLDGANSFTRFWRIAFPLMWPVTGTVVILNGLFVWNDFFTPLLYLNGTPYSTVPLAIYTFVGGNLTNWSLVFAALIMSVIPVLIIFFFVQKKLIKGFASGLKG